MASSRTSRSRYRPRSTGRDIRPRLISGEMRRGCQPGVGSRQPAIGRARGCALPKVRSGHRGRQSSVVASPADFRPAATCRAIPPAALPRLSRNRRPGRLGRSQAGHLCLLDHSLRAREDRIDRGKFFRKWAGVIIELHSCTSRLAIGLRACRLDDTAGSMFDCGPACPLKLLPPL